MIERKHRYGNLVFDRDAIVRAALRAYVEAVLWGVASFSLPTCDVPGWTGDLQRGAFYNGDGCGNYNVVAWTEAGVVGLAYEIGWGPLEHLDLPVDAVTGGLDDVRGALPELPDALTPALVMAAGLLGEGSNHGEKQAGVGFWLLGDRVAGTLFEDPTDVGARQLAMWGLLQGGRLLLQNPSTAAHAAMLARTKNAPVHAVMDAVVDRRLGGPTEFTTDEITTLTPTPSDPEQLLAAQRSLQKVGITWPGSPELPEPPKLARRSAFVRQS